jgi:hypothetical protein
MRVYEENLQKVDGVQQLFLVQLTPEELKVVARAVKFMWCKSSEDTTTEHDLMVQQSLNRFFELAVRSVR